MIDNIPQWIENKTLKLSVFIIKIMLWIKSTKKPSSYFQHNRNQTTASMSASGEKEKHDENKETAKVDVEEPEEENNNKVDDSHEDTASVSKH